MYLPDAKVLRIIRINLISLLVESCLFKVICMKNSFIVLFALSMAVIGCDKNHDNEDTDVTLGKISRIDVRSYSEEDDVYFNKIFCFSYGLDGKISSCSILYPSDAYREERIDEEIRYSMDYSQSSLALSVDYRMLMYDGIHDDYAIGSETEHDMADCFEMVDGNVRAVNEYDGPYFYFSSLQYQYDEDGYLIKKTDAYDDFNSLKLEWNDGNLTGYVKGSSNPLIADIEYTDYKAPEELGNFLTDFILNSCDGLTSPYVFYTGKSSVNLPSHVSFKTPDDDYSSSIGIEYGYSDGRVNTMKCVLTDSYDVYTFLLTFYYDRQSADDFEWVPVKQ